jgi:hypothetical protein
MRRSLPNTTNSEGSAKQQEIRFAPRRVWKRTHPIDIKYNDSDESPYDLHQDIWKRSMEINLSEIEKRDRKNKKHKKEQDEIILSLYDLHQDIWSMSMKQIRNKRITYENDQPNILHKQKPVSPKQSRGNNQAVTPTQHKFSCKN